MDLKKIPKFEQQNDLSINVYTLKIKNINTKEYEGDDYEIDLSCMDKKNLDYNVVPVHVSENYNKRHIHLLMIEKNNNDYDANTITQKSEVQYHFCWIKSLSRLMGSSLSNNKSKKIFCDRCLSYFTNEDKLQNHVTDCMKFGAVRSIMPKQDNKWLKFKNFKNKEKTPFVIYADIECLTVPIPEDMNTSSNEKQSIAYQKHEPYSVGYHLQCSYNEELNKTKIYRGNDCIQWFIKELREIAENTIKTYAHIVPMEELTEEEQENFKAAQVCHICETKFENDEDENKIRVRDHCHLTGVYRGAAHNQCNLNYQNPHYIPVICHNLSGYDAHFIIKDLCKEEICCNDGEVVENPGNVSLLPINKEIYKSFSKSITIYEGGKKHMIQLRFIDSYQFMKSSLASLAENLEPDNMKATRNYYKNLNDDKFKLLTRKGIFPYDYIQTWDRLEETTLPSKEEFYSKMKESHITNEDYAHAINVWNSFDCQNLGEYSDLYLKTDVLLLVDVFENFRNLCLKTYKLDAAHYFTAPGLGWDAMLKKSKVELELLTDIDMLLFIENGIRGGLCQCSKRYAKCNNKYYEKEYDTTKPPKYLMYYDAVNLYGWAMIQYLPFRGFKWLDEDQFQNIDITNIEDDSNIGYILEVDLEYPQELHDSHKDLPFLPERTVPPGRKEMKLLATLHNKTKYIVHYRNLKHVLKNGLQLKKIHRILEFQQEPWMRSYIELNTKLRQETNNKFEKDFYKLMNNSVFGKTMQNVRKMRDVKLVTKWEGRYGVGRYISKPNFKDRVIFNENLVAIELNRLEVYFNKPIFVGMAILDISKTKIYGFHYEYIKNKYGQDTNLLYTDTDSLIYEIFTNDIYEDIKSDAEKWYDTSDFSNNNPYGIPSVNKVLGMMKDELAGQVVTHFVSTGAKSYAYKVYGKDLLKNGEEEKRLVKAKGFRSNEKSYITFDDYFKCINDNLDICRSHNIITSKKHEVYSVQQNKTVISTNDDKRHVVSNSFETLPYGHYFFN